MSNKQWKKDLEEDGVVSSASLPTFENDKEMEAWLETNQDALLPLLEKAKPIMLDRVMNLPKKQSKPISVRLDPEDIAYAKKIADRKGIGYQTYLKMLIHEGIRRDLKAI